MWTCPNCNRIFERKGQSHSCQTATLEEHFKNKEHAKSIFDNLLKEINTKIGKSKIISLPCCVHLFGEYDFLAALPKRDRLEIRFGLNRPLDGPRIKQVVPVSQLSYKNCLDLTSSKDIDEELLGWIRESYFLKGKL